MFCWWPCCGGEKCVYETVTGSAYTDNFSSLDSGWSFGGDTVTADGRVSGGVAESQHGDFADRHVVWSRTFSTTNLLKVRVEADFNQNHADILKLGIGINVDINKVNMFDYSNVVADFTTYPSGKLTLIIERENTSTNVWTQCNFIDESSLFAPADQNIALQGDVGMVMQIHEDSRTEWRGWMDDFKLDLIS